jgi:hypothetical protein
MVWRWNVDTSENISEIPGNFLNVVVENDSRRGVVFQLGGWARC